MLPDEKLSRKIDRRYAHKEEGIHEPRWAYIPVFVTYSLHLLFGGAASGCDN